VREVKMRISGSADTEGSSVVEAPKRCAHQLLEDIVLMRRVAASESFAVAVAPMELSVDEKMFEDVMMTRIDGYRSRQSPMSWLEQA
jgi:hypothetical protein